MRQGAPVFLNTSSSIRTVTVGPGVSPGQPLARVADFTASGEFHPALKTLFSDVMMSINPPEEKCKRENENRHSARKEGEGQGQLVQGAEEPACAGDHARRDRDRNGGEGNFGLRKKICRSGRSGLAGAEKGGRLPDRAGSVCGAGWRSRASQLVFSNFGVCARIGNTFKSGRDTGC